MDLFGRKKLREHSNEPVLTFYTGKKIWVSGGLYSLGSFQPEKNEVLLSELILMILDHLALEINIDKAIPEKISLVKKEKDKSCHVKS